MKIGILGAGIGGLSSAISLKLKGFDITVYERNSGPAQIGAGIVCWPNASFVLDQLGLLDAIASCSGAVTKMHRFSSEGEAIGSLDIDTLNQSMGYRSYSILRVDLIRILTERALELGVVINYQHVVAELNSTAKLQTDIVFTNGKCVTPDRVIGADGRMNSLARSYVNQDNQPVYQRFINWIGVFESATDVFDQLEVADYWGCGERFGIVPVTKRRAYWAGGAFAAEVADNNPDQYRTELESRFTHWPDPIMTMISQTPLQRINKVFLYDHQPIDIWHKNNLLLLGDAAHAALPTSGQGACQALEDAWHLANCLSSSTDEDCQSVFSAFTALRQAKTASIISMGRHLAANIFNPDPQFCQQRNAASKETDYHSVVNAMAKGWSSGLPL